MKRVLALALAIALAGSMDAAYAQAGAGGTAKSPTRKKAAVPAVSTQINELKEAIEAQAKQLQMLGQQIQARDQRIQQLEQRLDQNQAADREAQAKADAAAAQTADEAQAVSSIKSDVADLKTAATGAAMTLQETQKALKDTFESPLSIHFKGITITPGGFLAAESVYRNRAIGADINSQFNGLNFPGSGQNAVSEFFYSGRQSRVSLLAEGKLGDAKMTGYFEGDFLSAGVTSNNNTSNSYTFRQRQVWGQIASGPWTFTGGQMWSLMEETRHGLDNRSEALPMTIDPQYTVGFSWARQAGVRLVRNFNNKFWLGASIENPTTTFAARGNSNNFAFGGPGNLSGAYNNQANYSFNATPDFIIKAAFEPGFGHYEIYGIGSRFRDRIYPCAETNPAPPCNDVKSVVGATNASVNGGGFGANARFTVVKHVEFGLHALEGRGVGRYGTGGLPDATVNPDGTLAPLRSYQGLATLELHYPRFDIYMNGGEEYIKRRYAADPLNGGTIVGYGAPTQTTAGCYSETLPGAGGYAFGALSGCSADTQSLIEGTIGVWIKVHQGPKGRLQFGPQYSYVSRNAWAGTFQTTPTTTYSSPHGIDNMFFTSFRYYLP